MSSNTDEVSSTSSATSSSSSAATNTTSSEPVTSSSSSAGAGSTSGSSIDMNETVGSISELQQKAPAVWNAILQGIAQSMISQMQNDNDQLVQMMKKSQQENS